MDERFFKNCCIVKIIQRKYSKPIYVLFASKVQKDKRNKKCVQFEAETITLKVSEKTKITLKENYLMS